MSFPLTASMVFRGVVGLLGTGLLAFFISQSGLSTYRALRKRIAEVEDVYGMIFHLIFVIFEMVGLILIRFSQPWLDRELAFLMTTVLMGHPLAITTVYAKYKYQEARRFS